MILIIDGYNLLRSIFYREKGKLDKQRDQLIKLLGFYKTQQAEKIKQLMIVFDAGPDRHASREVRNGVVVFFSGQRRSADDWIVEYVAKHHDHEIFLVSDDQMLLRRSQNKSKHVSTMKTEAFYKLIQERCASLLREDALKDFGKQGIQKYHRDDEPGMVDQDSTSSLDMLMEEGSRKVPPKKEDRDIPFEMTNRQSSQKLSKKERERLLKTKKLL